MALLNFVVIGMLLNATFGYYQKEQEISLKEIMQSILPKTYPIDYISDENEGHMLRKHKSRMHRFKSSIYNYLFPTTVPTTTLDPKIYEFAHELRTVLDLLEKATERMSSLIKQVNIWVKKNVNRSLNSNVQGRVKRDTDVNVTDKQQNLTDSGRKMLMSKTNLIKAKLLHYLEETFYDIEENMELIERVKQSLFNNVPYKVGYIISNLDNLIVYMRNLKEEVKRNEDLWGEEEILDVYDHLKTSQNIIINLINTLKVYINKE